MIVDVNFLYSMHSPAQVVPFPLYPWLQAQVKLPGVLVQVALVSQLSVPSLHSLLSNIVNSYIIATYYVLCIGRGHNNVCCVW